MMPEPLTEKTFFITGGQGQLGQAFAQALTRRGLLWHAPLRSELDITDEAAVRAYVADKSPHYIVNCAAYNDVEKAESDQARAMLVNAAAAGFLAAICRERGIVLVHFSSDYVFDGKKGDLYREEDAPHPLNVYGASKLAGEEMVRASDALHLIFRLSWVFGEGTQNFLYKVRQWAAKSSQLKISADEISRPTYTEDIVEVSLLSLEKGLRGLFHLTNSGQASRFEFAEYFIKKAGLKVSLEPVRMAQFGMKAVRPLFSCLSNSRISAALKVEIPSWQQGVDRYVGKTAFKPLDE